MSFWSLTRTDPSSDWLKPGKIKDADGNKQGTPEYNPRTLYIPPSAASKFGNFEKQFWEQKSQNFDSIVFFQKGESAMSLTMSGYSS